MLSRPVRAQDGAPATPPATLGAVAATDERRGAVDVARVLALLVVVVGHLTIAVVDRGPDGALRGANLLTLHPGWAWLGVLSPMPVFFAAGGWANATATPRSAGPRLRLLVGLAVVVTAAWGSAVVVATVVSGSAGVLAQGARVSTQPLWFLAAYLPLAVSGAALARAAARRPVLSIGGCLLLLLALDLARFGLGGPSWLGWPGFYAAWAVPWLAGGWWRARFLSGSGFRERTAGLRIVAGAGVAAFLLARHGGYHPSLIDVEEAARSNTTPPTLYTAVAALAQAGFLLVVAAALDAWARRWRTLWDRLAEAAVAVYVWHLTALSLCAAVIAAGLPVPRRLTLGWWLTRPVWWAAILTVTVAFVAATAPLRGRLAGDRRAPSRAPVAAVVVAAGTAAFVGLRGPRTAALALLCIGGFALARWLLGGRAGEAGSRGPLSPVPTASPVEGPSG